jgi:CCR4-NOT transcription complex subunit 1
LSLLVFFNPQLQHEQVITRNDDIFTLFFRLPLEYIIDQYQSTKTAQLPLRIADSYAKLVSFFVKYNIDPNPSSKLPLLQRIAGIVALVLIGSAERGKANFNQKPFFRVFLGLLNEINSFEPNSGLLPQALFAVGSAFFSVRPQIVPAFVFSWVELISNRLFMPKLLLNGPNMVSLSCLFFRNVHTCHHGIRWAAILSVLMTDKIISKIQGWPLVLELLSCLFRFQWMYLQTAELGESTRLLYKASLRILLVLLHDFPEFLAAYHHQLCEVIPPTCVQLRNLVLSAFPRNMRLPDPFTPQLKVDLLPESQVAPVILSDYTAPLMLNGFKKDIDSYLKTRSPVSFLLELRSKLMLPTSEVFLYQTKYNIAAINSLVLYLGIHAVTQLQGRAFSSAAPLAHSPHMDIFQHVMMDLDTEGTFLQNFAFQLCFSRSRF